MEVDAAPGEGGAANAPPLSGEAKSSDQGAPPPRAAGARAPASRVPGSANSAVSPESSGARGPDKSVPGNAVDLQQAATWCTRRPARPTGGAGTSSSAVGAQSEAVSPRGKGSGGNGSKAMPDLKTPARPSLQIVVDEAPRAHGDDALLALLRGGRTPISAHVVAGESSNELHRAIVAAQPLDAVKSLFATKGGVVRSDSEVVTTASATVPAKLLDSSRAVGGNTAATGQRDVSRRLSSSPAADHVFAPPLPPAEGGTRGPRATAKPSRLQPASLGDSVTGNWSAPGTTAAATGAAGATDGGEADGRGAPPLSSPKESNGVPTPLGPPPRRAFSSSSISSATSGVSALSDVSTRADAGIAEPRGGRSLPLPWRRLVSGKDVNGYTPLMTVRRTPALLVV